MKNEFKFGTTKPNLDSWAKRLTWFDCNTVFDFVQVECISNVYRCSSFAEKQSLIKMV